MSTPSLLNIPYLYKAGTLYSQIPESGAGDFTVSRTTTVANRSTRINKDGLIELVNDNVPRLDYPVGGAVNGCPALLVEPSAQNIFQRSEEFNDAYWVKNLASFTQNSIIAPDGTNTADKIFATAAPGNHFFTRTSTQTGQHTFSIFVKASEYSFIRLQDVNSGTYNVSFNLLAGVASGTGASIQNYGNGWYRCIVTYNGGGLSVSNGFIGVSTLAGSISYTGDGVSGVFVWGAQLETGSVPTSYIPTTTAAVTRSGETISKTGVSSLIGQTEGTIYAEVDIRNMAKETYILEIDDGSNTNRVIMRSLTSNLMRGSIVAPGASGIIGISSATFNAGIIKIAFAYKSGDFALSVNGATALTASGTFTFGASLNRVTLGGVGGGGFQLNDRIRAVEIHPNRLSNAQLATLTAL